MSHGKMSDFVSFPLFGFTLVIKLGNFNFESYQNTLMFFDKKCMFYSSQEKCIGNTYVIFFHKIISLACLEMSGLKYIFH